MTERLKNVGLHPETHKRLKLLCAEQGWTMTQAVDALIEVMHGQERNAGNPGANRRGKPARGKPGQAD